MRVVITFILIVGISNLVSAQTNTFPSSGSVGIGTTSPSKLLHLKNSSWQQLVFDRTENSNVNDLFFIGPSYKSDESNDGLRFSSSTENLILFLGAAGNIGVGTRNITAELTVDGKVQAKEVIVEENVGADFVFEENYDLSSLPEVENYIKKHKHLPDIPSAEQMKRNGVKVGDLQMKLLQKIEELTLHLIKQEKTEARLENRLEKETQINSAQQKVIQELLLRIEKLESQD